MKLVIPEGKIDIQVHITCPFCDTRQGRAEEEFVRLLDKMILCENEYCHNYFKLPGLDIIHEQVAHRESS